MKLIGIVFSLLLLFGFTQTTVAQTEGKKKHDKNKKNDPKIEILHEDCNVFMGTDDTKAIGEVSVSEGRTMFQVRSVLRKNIGGVLNCYRENNGEEKKLTANLMVAFKINMEGDVYDIQMLSCLLSSPNPNIEPCIILLLGKIKFPKCESNYEVNVMFPLTLEPQS